jgi:hypothetical protein
MFITNGGIYVDITINRGFGLKLVENGKMRGRDAVGRVIARILAFRALDFSSGR